MPPLLQADTLIDFPPEIVSQAWRWGVDFSRMTALFVTHSHGDHFLPYLLRWRYRPARLSPHPDTSLGGPRFTELPLLRIVGNAAVEARLRDEIGNDLFAYDIEFIPITPFQPLEVNGWEALPVAANHDVGVEDAVNYILHRDGTTIFYGLDSNEPLPATWDALCAHRFDLMIWEGTYGLGNGGNHMNFERLIQTAERIQDAGLLNEGGRIIASHFSPHHGPPHAETADILRPHGIETAFDGMDWEPA